MTAARLCEAPASTVRCGNMNLPVAGGGYFRILPYAWTRWGIAPLEPGVERRPAIFYLHPWEIDPRSAAARGRSCLSRFRHYRNLDKTEPRLALAAARLPLRSDVLRADIGQRSAC